MKRMILFILLWFSISSQIILSQSNNWIRYCVGNTGLPDLAVHDLIQNSNGHYLIATQSGLAEFDGQIWTVYDTSNTDLTRLDVLSVAVTADNIIWIATSQSISGPIYPYFASFNGTQWSIYTDEDENILSSSISKILVDNSERVWFSTANGLLMYDGTFHSYKPSGDLWGPLDCPMLEMAIAPSGSIYSISPYNILWIFDGTNFQKIESTFISGVNDMAIDSHGIVWFATQTGLVKYDGIDFTLINTENSELPDNWCNAVEVDQNDNIWIGLTIGIVKKDELDQMALYSDYLSFYDVTAMNLSNIKFDNAGNLFVLGNGFYKYDYSQWTPYSVINTGLPDNQVQSIYIDNNDKKWIASFHEGFARFDGTYWNNFTRWNSLLITGEAIYDIAAKSNNNIWVITSGDIQHYNASDWQAHDLGQSVQAASVDIDKLGVVWISTWQHGVYSYDGTTWNQFSTSNSGLPSNVTHFIKVDNANNKWIGTDGGLVKYDGTNWGTYDTFIGLPNNKIIDVAVYNDKIYAVPQNSGFAIIENNSCSVYSTTNSDLVTNYIESIAVDNNGIVWLGTNAGLVSFDGVNFTQFYLDNSPIDVQSIPDIVVDQYNNKWIATYGNTLNRTGGVFVYREDGVIISVDDQNKSKDFRLEQNYPNPFNPVTTISFTIVKDQIQQGKTELIVYDILGREVAVLINEIMQPGNYEIKFNASHFASGVYFYKLTCGHFSQTKKMIVLK